MNFFERASAILGMNARNLLYVDRFNSRSSKRFADDKLFTKNYLSSRGLGVAKLYAVIKSYQQLRVFKPESLPQSFVIKPNRGFGGEGIIVIIEHEASHFKTISGEKLGWDDLFRHIISILDGRYAISGLHDQCLIEEKLDTAPYLVPIAPEGLPDIRIIVFNMVPVIAMLRLPTKESRGKANLHLGGVGVGIDIASGHGRHAVLHNRFITRLPSGQKITDVALADWPAVLLAAAKAQQVSRIGYLAVDLAPTATGIKILELNARAGLSVQIANQVPLKNRLKKIVDLNVTTPEKGVEISQTLFGVAVPVEKRKPEAARTIIAPYEIVEILTDPPQTIRARIDPHAEHNFLDERISLPSNEAGISIKIRERRVFLPVQKSNFTKNNDFKMSIAGKFLKDFLIDPSLATDEKEKVGPSRTPGSSAEKIIKNIDRVLYAFDRELNLLSIVKPLNFEDAQKAFFEDPSRSPVFHYRALDFDPAQTRRKLKSLPRQIDHPLAPMLFKKIEELNARLDFIEARDTVAMAGISQKLFGRADKKVFLAARRYLKTHAPEPDTSPVLTAEEARRALDDYLRRRHLRDITIDFSPDHPVDVAVNRSGKIFLNSRAEFSAHRLAAVIAHEIETHLFRTKNGAEQSYQIFLGGPYYMATEEGLAVYNQEKLGIPLGEKKLWPALRAVGAYLAQQLSFAELYAHLTTEYGVSRETAWRTCFKVKRGVGDTNRPYAFTRDSIYFTGAEAITAYAAAHPSSYLQDLYIGKIALEDIAICKKFDFIKPPKYIPDAQRPMPF